MQKHQKFIISILGQRYVNSISISIGLHTTLIFRQTYEKQKEITHLVHEIAVCFAVWYKTAKLTLGEGVGKGWGWVIRIIQTIKRQI